MLHLLDQMRRARGRALDAVGLGPQETPSRIVLETAAFRLRDYGPERDGAPVVLILPAPIKRHYIWDLAPEVSAVRRLADGGLRTFLVEWLPVEDAAGDGLDGYADRFPAAALDAVAAIAGGPPPVLAGHSLGGTLAGIFAALHPDRVGGLILLEAPLRFGAHAGAFAPFVRNAPRAAELVAPFGAAPGSLLNLASATAAPGSFVWSVLADRAASLGDPDLRRLHARVRRWTLDEFAMPARLFEQVVDGLYREDRFVEGALAVGGAMADARRLSAPVLAVADPESRVVPPESALPDLPALSRPDSLVLDYHGDSGVALRHVGVLVGPSAHRDLWPRIVAWARERGASGRS